MIQSGFIAAIDLGTSNIKGVVGRKNENSVISILACKTIPSNNSIRRGLVYNIEDAGATVRGMVQMLENSLENKIDKVYVSWAGQSLHTVEWCEKQSIAPGDTVTEEIITQLRKSAERFTPDLKCSYAVGDVEYFIDGKSEKKPVGIACTQIEAKYKIIAGRPNLKSNIEKSIKEKAGLKIAGNAVGALASAAIALNDEEKELGCAFVDFGAGTTTLSIYKGGILHRMVVVPFGGKNITDDISELNFTKDQAEALKIKYGKATEHKHSSKLSSPFSSPFSLKPDTDFTEMNNVIKMRLDEIIANIEEQIRQSGYEGQLGAGLVITGGASQLRNLDIYLTEKLKMPVRKASAKKTLVNNSPEQANDPALTQVLGMLFLATENCAKIKVEESDEDTEAIKPKKELRIKKPKDPNAPGLGKKISDLFEGMFKEE